MADLPPLLKAALQLRAETDLSRLFLPAMTTSNRPPLSPAAQTVLDAWLKSENGERMLGDPACLAVALRAVADQVVPKADTNRSPCREGCVIGAAPERIRRDLLAIAAELEAQP